IEACAMVLMRRRPSAVVMEGAPLAEDCFRCATANPGRTARSSIKCDRIVVASDEGGAKANAPDRERLRSGAFPDTLYQGLRRLSSGSARGFSLGDSRFGSARGSLRG